MNTPKHFSPRRFKPTALGVIASLALTVGGAFVVAQGQKGRVEFPRDFRTAMPMYATVDRGDGKVYEIYVNRLALEVWQRERRLPSGAQFVIESFNASRNADGSLARDPRGRLVKAESDFEIHVTEKRMDWAQNADQTSRGLLFGNATPNGTWRVGAFDPRTGERTPKTSAQVAECHQCHTERRAEDFVLSRGLLDQFARSGQPAHISFNCSEREICFGTP